MARLSHAARQSAQKEVSPLSKGSRTSMVHWDCDVHLLAVPGTVRYLAVPCQAIYDAFILWGAGSYHSLRYQNI